MATLSALRGRVKVLLMLGQQDATLESGSPTNADIDATINEERATLFTHLANLYPARYETETSDTYTANSESIAITAAVAAGLSLTMVSALPSTSTDTRQKYPLDNADRSEFANYSVQGAPQLYAVEGSLLYLRPIPGVDYTVYYRSVAAIADLTANQSPSEIPANFHHVLAYLAAASYKKRAGDPDAGVMQDKAQEIVDDLESLVETQVMDQGFKVTKYRRW